VTPRRGATATRQPLHRVDIAVERLTHRFRIATTACSLQRPQLDHDHGRQVVDLDELIDLDWVGMSVQKEADTIGPTSPELATLPQIMKVGPPEKSAFVQVFL
jgi:hypothetical protein